MTAFPARRATPCFGPIESDPERPPASARALRWSIAVQPSRSSALARFEEGVLLPPPLDP